MPHYATNTDGTSSSKVPNFQLYKALRTEELRCYRSLLRVLTMARGTNLTRHDLRTLEDVRELCHVSDARHDVEYADAINDPVLQAIKANSVGAKRDEFLDAASDIVIPSAEEQDDGGIVAADAIGGRNKVKPTLVTKKRVSDRSVLSAANENQLATDIRLIGEDVRRIAQSLVLLPRHQRGELEARLGERRIALNGLRMRREEELRNGAQ